MRLIQVKAIGLHFYLDDGVVKFRYCYRIKSHTQYVVPMATFLGWIVNLLESDLELSHDPKYVGIQCDLVGGLTAGPWA